MFTMVLELIQVSKFNLRYMMLRPVPRMLSYLMASAMASVSERIREVYRS